MKQVGKRTSEFFPIGDFRALKGFFDLTARLAGNRVLAPRGVYRFATFEEADEWWLKVIAEGKVCIPDRHRSKT